MLPLATSKLVAGLPWLQQHSPIIDWSGPNLLSWGPTCHANCLGKVVPVKTLPVASAEDSSLVPTHYAELLDEFSKRRADQLLPNRPYNCAIDLVPGSSVPRGWVYPLSLPETKTMNEYVTDNLQKGFI